MNWNYTLLLNVFFEGERSRYCSGAKRNSLCPHWPPFIPKKGPHRLMQPFHWSLKNKNHIWISVILTTDFLSFFFFPPASRHCLQVKNTPTAAKATKQNISIPVDGICLRTCDLSGAACHVSDCPVWEPAQPRELLSRGKDGGRNPSQLTTLTSNDNSGRGLPSRLPRDSEQSLERC